MSKNIPAGTVVQYRKVGTFRVIRPADTFRPSETGNGWYIVEAVKAPKSYRDKGDAIRMWVDAGWAL